MKDHLSYAVYKYKSVHFNGNTTKYCVLTKSHVSRIPETYLIHWELQKVSTYTSQKTAERKAVEMQIKAKLEGRG